MHCRLRVRHDQAVAGAGRDRNGIDRKGDTRSPFVRLVHVRDLVWDAAGAGPLAAHRTVREDDGYTGQSARRRGPSVFRLAHRSYLEWCAILYGRTGTFVFCAVPVRVRCWRATVFQSPHEHPAVKPNLERRRNAALGAHR